MIRNGLTHNITYESDYVAEKEWRHHPRQATQLSLISTVTGISILSSTAKLSSNFVKVVATEEGRRGRKDTVIECWTRSTNPMANNEMTIDHRRDLPIFHQFIWHPTIKYEKSSLHPIVIYVCPGYGAMSHRWLVFGVVSCSHRLIDHFPGIGLTSRE